MYITTINGVKVSWDEIPAEKTYIFRRQQLDGHRLRIHCCNQEFDKTCKGCQHLYNELCWLGHPITEDYVLDSGRADCPDWEPDNRKNPRATKYPCQGCLEKHWLEKFAECEECPFNPRNRCS